MVPIKNKEQLIAVLIANSNEINSYGVKQLGVFGSFVRNEAGEDSDVDFFIEFYPEKKTFDNFIELSFFLERLLSRKIEIVTPKSVSKYIAPYILNEVEYVPLAA